MYIFWYLKIKNERKYIKVDPRVYFSTVVVINPSPSLRRCTCVPSVCISFRIFYTIRARNWTGLTYVTASMPVFRGGNGDIFPGRPNIYLGGQPGIYVARCNIVTINIDINFLVGGSVKI